MRVLVVEDSLIARTMLKDMLSLLEHEIAAEAGNKAQAVAAYKEHKPDVVTVDLGLGQDLFSVNVGIELIQELRTIDPFVKILVLTANNQDSLRARALSAGAYDFVPKPISIDHLRVAIARAKPA